MAPKLLIFTSGCFKCELFCHDMIITRGAKLDFWAFPFFISKIRHFYAHSPEGEALGKIHHFQVERSF